MLKSQKLCDIFFHDYASAIKNNKARLTCLLGNKKKVLTWTVLSKEHFLL